MFAHRYRYLFIVGIAVYSYANTLYVEALDYYQIPLQHWLILTLFIGIVWGIWEGNRMLEKLLPLMQAWVQRVSGRKPSYLVGMFSGSIILTFLVVAIPSWLVSRYQLHYTWQQFQMPAKLVLTLGFRINLFLNTLNAIFFFLRQQREAQLEAERFKKISVQAQFQSLKSQVNPHFLFNSLNVLSTLVHKDPDVASEFIEELAKVYRYVLQNFEKELIELETELTFIESYVYLLEKRFGSSLQIELNIPSKFRTYYVVPVAIQMLIENAIKHNISSRNRPLHIYVYIDANNHLVVKNNLQLKPEKETSTQIGLENISKRYQFVSSQGIVIQQDKDFFTILLPLLHVAA